METIRIKARDLQPGDVVRDYHLGTVVAPVELAPEDRPGGGPIAVITVRGRMGRPNQVWHFGADQVFEVVREDRNGE